MKRVNILSCLLVMLFMVSCLCFFSVTAEPDSDDPTVKTTEQHTTAKATTEQHTTVKVTTKAIATTVTTKATTRKTKKVTSADPVYTTTKPKTTTKSYTSSAAGVVTTHLATTEATAETKETKEIQTTESTTEPTTAAKNIVDYGSKYRPLKWLSLAVMIGCIIALVAINVRYKKKYGKYSGKGNGKGNKNVAKKNAAPKLDTSARFTEPTTPQRQQYQKPVPQADENLDKTTVVDISSFSNKNRQNDFKPQTPKAPTAEKEEIFNTKNDDDDLYI